MRVTIPLRLRRALIDHPLRTLGGTALLVLGALGGLPAIIGFAGGVVPGIAAAVLVLACYFAILSVAYSNELDDVTGRNHVALDERDSQIRILRREHGDEIATYRHALNTLVDRHSGVFIEDVELTYHIGIDDRGDTERRDCETRAASGGTILWRWFEGASEAAAGQVQKPPGRPVSSPEVSTLLLAISDTYLKVMVLFRKSVTESEPLRWWVQRPWPGMFEDFRTDGNTRVEYTAHEGCRLSRLTVIFDDPTARGTKGESPTGPMDEVEVGGSYALRWAAPTDANRVAQRYVFTAGVRRVG